MDAEAVVAGGVTCVVLLVEAEEDCCSSLGEAGGTDAVLSAEAEEDSCSPLGEAIWRRRLKTCRGPPEMNIILFSRV
jgi:hypothetical protein